MRTLRRLGFPADKVKKYPVGDGLYFVVGCDAAHTGPISSAVARRGRRKVSAAIRSSARRMRRDRLAKHWQVTGSLPGEPPRAGPEHTWSVTAEVGVPFTEALSQWLAIASLGWRNPRTAAQASPFSVDQASLSAEPVDRINTATVLRDLLQLPARQRQDVRMWLAALLDFTKGQKVADVGPR